MGLLHIQLVLQERQNKEFVQVPTIHHLIPVIIVFFLRVCYVPKCDFNLFFFV